MSNKLRIIGGEWRSRQIVFDDAPGLRPTPDRVRETLFNWLQTDIANSRCLDLYAGSGALGFEAASRGARSVVQVENHPKVCQKLRENTVRLGANQVTLQAADVMQFLRSRVDEGFDLIFLDPPFGQNQVVAVCLQLEEQGWLVPYAKIYIEAERQLTLTELPVNWSLLKNRVAGQVAFYLFQRQE